MACGLHKPSRVKKTPCFNPEKQCFTAEVDRRCSKPGRAGGSVSGNGVADVLLCGNGLCLQAYQFDLELSGKSSVLNGYAIVCCASPYPGKGVAQSIRQTCSQCIGRSNWEIIPFDDGPGCNIDCRIY